jgi:hypothetical protein
MSSPVLRANRCCDQFPESRQPNLPKESAVIVLGFILFAVAVAAALVLIVQNRGDIVTLHALGNTWNVHLYWLLALGAIVVVVALLGLAMMRGGSARARRLRRERKSLSVENERLQGQVARTADTNVVADGDADATVPRGAAFRHPFHRAESAESSAP